MTDKPCSGQDFMECAGCGTKFPRNPRGRLRKWCSEKCRKRSYGDLCVDCGATTCFGAEHARVPEPRCHACASRRQRIWTREVIVARIWEWNAIYGEPPAAPDWRPTQARIMNDPDRAYPYEQSGDRWPSVNTVVRVFGRWNAGIEAAGFVPRRADGGGDNALRRRSERAKRAAA